MTVSELDAYFRSILAIDDLAGVDYSLNGLQVGRFDMPVRKVAFAVDACEESILRTKDIGAQMLFVHHGLFWGKEQSITGSHYRRIAALIENDIALYAAHLPLDMHETYGNNAGLAKQLGLKDIEPFGVFRRVRIGCAGRFETPQTIDDVLALLEMDREELLGVLAFGPEKISSVAIISGGADKDVEQAIEKGVDLYLTGELSHQVYHLCQESGINLIAAGHYRTEVYGVQLMAGKLEADTGIETCFIDLPTGL
ncbi:Nif3-like dinuclear metal center hexameric protein [Sediminispirochaeta smaragdinae]|jgi:dinuclear metal center YbgI/SA1388 family protein|uniref:GTP cyclohydrolase 1 type 2 homolog n=1 Tax=Sediminispirochaeta smaragdinae (strain DSM 11293 / JCM 15392 / SEBR 4228) TaxID=573413 RepID=E1RAU8_SEDSS|nr:Nif3-like dinuclear metal center hexameric protein [Sediminispirochaeta smaragdinae]ADK79478.1 protein of unknown function DUF34 [Sediminispirochaeta smaragdinae DSM 11293]